VGVSIWVRLKRDIEGIDPLDTDGKLLARAIEALDKQCRKLHVRPLSDYYSVSPKQALAEVEGGDDLTDEQWEALADDHAWWPPADGLKSVNALLQWMESSPVHLERSEEIAHDLRSIRVVLEAARREGVEFNVAVSA
jgi:hypothetical protein